MSTDLELQFRQFHSRSLRKLNPRAGEMVPSLRVLTALPEDRRFLSTISGRSQLPVTTALGDRTHLHTDDTHT